MAVVIGQTDSGARIYRSVNGIAISSHEQETADLVDQNIFSSLRSLLDELKSSGCLDKKEVVETYWRLGKLTNSLLVDSKLVPAEASYFFENVKLRLPLALFAEDRGPNRQHLKYCHRLGGYDESTALTLKWSEWVTLFDSTSINGELRFDVWFNDALEKEPVFFDREGVRLIAKVLNAFFNRLETSDLSDDELKSCYDQAKALCIQLKNDSSADIKMKLVSLKKQRMLVAQIIDDRICGEELYKII
tara:strand:+ start:2749 stop:3489 length:741 start_codon:yes stop_codon:yes gene_type:complete